MIMVEGRYNLRSRRKMVFNIFDLFIQIFSFDYIFFVLQYKVKLSNVIEFKGIIF